MENTKKLSITHGSCKKKGPLLVEVLTFERDLLFFFTSVGFCHGYSVHSRIPFIFQT